MEPNAFTVATVAKRHTQRASIGIVTLGYAQVQEGQAREKGGTSRDRRRDGWLPRVCTGGRKGSHRCPPNAKSRFNKAGYLHDIDSNRY